MKRKIVVVIVILIGCIILITSSSVYLSISVKLHFLNWYGQETDCAFTSLECERYFETVHHLPCYLVYGHRDFETDNWTAHIWNIVVIDGVPHEFESTSLVFKMVSEKYTIQDMQEGFYVNGVKHEKSQKLNNWEGLIPSP